MQPRSGLITIGIGLLSVVLVLLAFQSFQLSNVEERLILQARQLEALGDSNDRLVTRVDALVSSGGLVAGGGGPARDPYADVEPLFPDRPNLLVADPFPIARPDAAQDTTLRRGWSTGDPNTFNPVLGNAAEVSSLIEHYVLEAAAARARFDDPTQMVSRLAWRVSANDDYTDFVIYLRRGVVWHVPGGVDLADERYAWLRGRHELTAHDYVFTFDLVRNPQVESGVRQAYEGIESVEALDDYTVRLRFSRSEYMNMLIVLSEAVLPEFLWAYDEDGERFPDETLGLRFNQHWYGSRGTVGTGPYRMVEYKPGERIVLERNDDYWGPRPSIKRIEYPIYSDPNRTLLMLKAHELQAGVLRATEYQREVLQWQDVPEAERPDSPFLNGDIACHKIRRYAYVYIGWNMDTPLFADREVRWAMTRAFNRQQMIDDIYFGMGEVATGPFNPAGPYNDPAIEPVPFDLAAAAEQLAGAGWADSDGDGLLDKDLDGDGVRDPFSFTLLMSANSPEVGALATVLKEDLLSIGVQMKLDAAEWSLMQKRMEEKQFDALTGGWAMPWESDPYYVWHSSQADEPNSNNMIGFRDPRVDVLIEELKTTFDLDERIAKYREIHRRVYDAMPTSFFRVPLQAWCFWSEIQGIRFAKARPQVDSLPWWIESR